MKIDQINVDLYSQGNLPCGGMCACLYRIWLFHDGEGLKTRWDSDGMASQMCVLVLEPDC